MQPLNNEYVTIKRAEYNDLVEIAKMVAELDPKKDCSVKIDILKLRLSKARRFRKL
jgi:hypothetical protein